MAFPFDSALPKDLVTINPHFNASDPAALLAALKANLIAWIPVSAHPFTLKAYDAATPPPSYPLATASQAGPPAPSGTAREIALCLSYYSTYNRPRFRGRLYLPQTWLGGQVQLRPTQTQIDTALAFKTEVLAKSLPAQANWVVWSTVEKKSQGGVSNVWVDDEWDTIRSRGLAPTARTLASVP
jgi:hypothetical protein